MAKKKQTLEQALLRLEEITRELERPETPLEDALTLYREGMSLSVFCAEKLDGVEKEIEVLKRQSVERGAEIGL